MQMKMSTLVPSLEAVVARRCSVKKRSSKFGTIIRKTSQNISELNGHVFGGNSNPVW